MSSVVVAEIVPKRLMESAPVSIAAHHFCYKLIDKGVFDDAVALSPIAIKNKIYPEHSDIKIISIRNFPHRSIFRLFNALIECISAYFKVSKYNTVWFYNINLHTLPLFLLTRYCSKAKPCLILADYTPEASFFKAQYWIGKAMWQSHAILSLSARTEYRKHKRFSVIPGILEQLHNSSSPKTKTPYVLFSGVLGAVTGITLAMEVFARIPHVNLVVTGKDSEEIVSDYAERYANIEYKGFVPQEEYNQILSGAFCCLNFRNPNLPENQNNFPSKMLEYLNHDKLVISTMHYPELEDIPYLSADYNIESCMNAVQKALEILHSGKQTEFCSSERIQSLCSPEKWKKTIQRLSM